MMSCMQLRTSYAYLLILPLFLLTVMLVAAQASDSGELAYVTNRSEGTTPFFPIQLVTTDGVVVDAWFPDGCLWIGDLVWFSDGRGLVYSCTTRQSWNDIRYNIEIFTHNLDSSEIVNITHHDAEVEVRPVISPDGTRVVFTSNRQWYTESSGARDFTNLFLMDSDGGSVRQLTFAPADTSPPVWLTDSSGIVFAAQQDIEGEDAPQDGSNSWYDAEIYRIDITQTEPALIRLTDNGLNDYSPAVSPDGSTIAYLTFDEPTRTIVLQWMSINGSPLGQVVVTQLAADQRDGNLGFDLWERMVDWSPDGASILFSNGEIYHIDLATRTVTRLTATTTVLERCARWSPDGTQIAYNANLFANGSDWDVYLMYADGSNPHPLTDSTGSDSCPQWRPLP